MTDLRSGGVGTDLHAGAKVPWTHAPELTVLEQVYGSPTTGRTVFKVVDARVGLTYALKVVELRGGQDARAVEREVVAFNRLALLPDRLPRVRAIEQSGPRCFVLMDWMEGSTLDRYTGGAPVRTPSELAMRLRVVGELCATVAALHDKRMAHRDLKPQNVVVRDTSDPSRGVAVLDLGLATQTRANWEGSDGYAAPEQAGFRQWSLSPRTDVFAVGQLLAFAIAGKPLPLRPASDLRHWEQDAGEMLQGTVGLSLPEPLRRCVRQCTALVPEHRPGNLNAVRHALRELSKGR
ncbi:MAG: protein kinase [Proteobacteria bacterium]|nr:protein kinase [Pseudomonadota bacterium]